MFKIYYQRRNVLAAKCAAPKFERRNVQRRNVSAELFGFKPFGFRPTKAGVTPSETLPFSGLELARNEIIRDQQRIHVWTSASVLISGDLSSRLPVTQYQA